MKGLEDAVNEIQRKKFDGDKDVGRPPHPGNSPVEVVPRRFYVEVTVSDLIAIMLSAKMKQMLMHSQNLKKNKIKAPQDPIRAQDLRANSMGKVV